MNVALRHGLHGLGEEYDYGGEYGYSSGSGETGSEGGGLPTGTVDYSSGETIISTDWIAKANCAEFGGAACAGIPGSDIIPYGQSSGAMTGPVPPLNSNQLATAIRAGTVVLSKNLPTGAKACPSGYATAQGACVPVQGAGIAGAPIIAGIPNQTLAIGVGILFLFMMMGGGRRR